MKKSGQENTNPGKKLKENGKKNMKRKAGILLRTWEEEEHSFQLLKWVYVIGFRDCLDG